MWEVTTLFSGPQIVGGGIQRFYFNSAAGTAAAAAADVAAFWGALDDNMQAGNTITVLGEIRTVTAETGAVTGISTTDTVILNTASGGEPLPPATQGLIRWLTEEFDNNRRIRGRTFIPAQQEAQSTNGVPSSGIMSAWSTAAGNLISSVNSTLVVWHRPLRDADGNITRAGSEGLVTSHSIWSQWASLRSRRDA